jgi:putative ABC transport system permease protein
MGSGSQLTITEDDAWAIQREIRTVAAATPTSRGAAQIVYGNLNWATSVQGVTEESRWRARARWPSRPDRREQSFR